MDPQTLTLRLETPEDEREVETLTREAFWNHHTPGCDEHYLAHLLRGCPAFVPELDYVAVDGGRIVGNIMYTKAKIVLDCGGELPVLTFGPISVSPACQQRGVGRAMIRHTAALAKAMGHIAILIYGDPAIYSRFGFVAAESYGIAAGDGCYRAALQAYELTPGALQNAAGTFVEDAVFQVDATLSEAFDRLFPPKEKLSGLASQARFLETVAMCKPKE